MTLKNVVSEIPDEISTCKAIKCDLEALKDWSSVFSSKAKVEAAIAKNMALHHKKITADITAVEGDYQDANYFKLGEDAAQLLADAIGPVEKPAHDDVLAELFEAEYGMPIQAPPMFAAGFLMEFIKVNNLSEVTTCIDSVENDGMQYVMPAIQDLMNKDINGAIEELTKMAAALQPDIQTCMGAKDQVVDVENFFKQYMGNKAKLVAKVTKAMTLHHK